MKRSIALLLLIITAACAGFTPPPLQRHGSAAANFNIRSLGAACDGTTNDDAAFAAAKAVMLADSRVVAGADVILTIPNGARCTFKSCSSNSYFDGLNNFTLIATGASLTSSGGCAQWGNGNIDGTNAGGAGGSGQVAQPIQTVSAGASCVTMVTASDASFYSPGRWAVIGAIGMQTGGYPPNWALWEYLQIASSDPTTGVVCFNSPLVNGYKSTWPDFGATGCSGYPCGGSPRLLNMETSWAHTWHEIGGTWHWDQPVLIISQRVILDNVTFVGDGSVRCNTNDVPCCQTPSVSQNVTFNNVTNTNCVVDADKEVQNWTINNSNMQSISFQTSSFLNVTLNNSTVSFINGSPKNLTCNNSTIGTVWFGGDNYGTGVSFAGSSCVINSVAMVFNNGGECTNESLSFCRLGSVSNGTFRLANISAYGSNGYGGVVPTWWLPGTVMYWQNGSGTIGGFEFTVNDSTCTSPSPCVNGSLYNFASTFSGSSFPGLSAGAQGIFIFPDIIRNWSCSSCSGSAIAADLSQAGAQSAPLFTYTSRTYTCTANLPNVPGASDLNHPTAYGVLGNMGTVTINVSTADTGPNGTLTFSTDQFGRISVVNQSTGTGSFWGFAVNLKTAGTRTITATGVAGNVSGDSPSTDFPGANSWLSNPIGTSGGVLAFTSADLTSEAAAQCPVVTLTFQLSR